MTRLDFIKAPLAMGMLNQRLSDGVPEWLTFRQEKYPGSGWPPDLKSEPVGKFSLRTALLSGVNHENRVISTVDGICVYVCAEDWPYVESVLKAIGIS